MNIKKALELFETNILKKGCKVKMDSLKGFTEFTEIEDVYIKKTRPGQLEDDWLVIVIDGQIYDSSYISEVLVNPTKTIINNVTGSWKNAKNKCRTTVNKKYSDIDATSSFKTNLLISEHSPIHLINVDWTWSQIKSWVATHWCRHKWDCFISTQRDDRTTTLNQKHTTRDNSIQSTPVNFDGYANAQHLIDSWRKRLCSCASPETRALAVDFKIVLHDTEPEIADVLVPNCVYRCGCPEFDACKFWGEFKKNNPNIDMTDIKERYEAYNRSIY